MNVRTIDPLREDASRFGLMLPLLVGLFMIIALAGCNTIGGAGEDIGAAGGAMSDTAEDVQDDM